MIEKLPRIPHFVTCELCQKKLEFTFDPPDVWSTWCRGDYECYGCDGVSRFICPVDPRGFKYHKCHYSQEIIPNMSPQRLWLNEDEIAAVLKPYQDSEERYFWNREIRADLDSIVIYTWEEV